MLNILLSLIIMASDIGILAFQSYLNIAFLNSLDCL